MKNRLTLKLFALISTADILESIADLLIKKGINLSGTGLAGVVNIVGFLLKLSTSYLVLLGILLYIVNFFILITVLSRLELSIAFPAGSISYILVPLLSIIFLHENVTLMRWSGIICIIAGIYFISRSGKEETS